MAKPIISVEGLGKSYRLGAESPRHVTFRDAMIGMLAAPVRRLRALADGGDQGDWFWAVQDVSFEIKRGDVVGVIGRNGAGKSTLLKLLSRITEPTTGRAVLRGRVASLLEVGTGFHPELSGRENVYLNGSILGMKKAEIDRKFDEIVAFAEIEKFLDTPVKRYSSGMYVRLAFAVAAHLEPEILIVDEVLAVGDAQFQRKCLGKMQEVAAGQGRTVLFVSHNMPAVRSLCRTGIVMERGRLAMRGSAEECVARYVNQSLDGGLRANNSFSRPKQDSPWMTSVRLLCEGEETAVVPMGAKLALEVEFAADVPIQHPRFGVVLSTADGEKLLNLNNRFQPSPQFDSPVTRGTIRCDLGMIPLVARKYTMNLYLGDQVHDSHVAEDALSFEVIEQDIWGQGKVPPTSQSHLWWPATFSFSAAG
ncbi:MAG TPA: ABC transporter ATP-binding protein [Tepidisphaeraceae bacterium]|nr:ABC transporter ATP-binding protein [Tepidisphaeraceae bacterium]